MGYGKRLAGTAAMFAMLAIPTTAGAANTWSGTWDACWDDFPSGGACGDAATMTLTQSGSSVTGSYNGTSGRISGNVNGNVTGNELTGSYMEGPTMPPRDRGGFTFKMSADGRSFTGTRTFSDGGFRGAWNGTCSGGACVSNTADDCPAPTKRQESCDEKVEFGFALDGFPDQPSASRFPDDLIGVQAKTSGHLVGKVTRKEKDGTYRNSGPMRWTGQIDFQTSYLHPDGSTTEGDFRVSGAEEVSFRLEPGKDGRIVLRGAVVQIFGGYEESCPRGGLVDLSLIIERGKSGNRAGQGKYVDEVALRSRSEGGCLAPMGNKVVWGNKDVTSSRIGKPKPVDPDPT